MTAIKPESKHQIELYYEKARTLSQMLLGQVAEHLGTKRIVVVSEGMLQYLPFDALPTPQQLTSERNIRRTPLPIRNT